MRSVPSLAAAGVLVVGLLTACGDDDQTGAASSSPATSGPAAATDRPRVVVTTSILGDVVAEVLGDQADVEVIMPLGADPHDFEASARQAEAMERADLLVVNGAGFEEGLLGIIESAEAAGAPIFAFSDHVELLEVEGESAEHAEDEGHETDGTEHAEDEGHENEGTDHAEGDEHETDGSDHAEDEAHEDGEEHGHEDGSDDPHFWTDPSRMATAVSAFAAQAGALEGVDAGAIDARATSYVQQLEALDAEIADALDAMPQEQRVLVTNHEVFGYFADRYDFEVVGTVIPSTTTNADASASDVEALAEVITERGVSAIFGETTQPTELADAIADEVGGDVEVVELYTESLGEPGSGAETYVAMMQQNAELISGALATS